MVSGVTSGAFFRICVCGILQRALDALEQWEECQEVKVCMGDECELNIVVSMVKRSNVSCLRNCN